MIKFFMLPIFSIFFFFFQYTLIWNKCTLKKPLFIRKKWEKTSGFFTIKPGNVVNVLLMWKRQKTDDFFRKNIKTSLFFAKSEKTSLLREKVITPYDLSDRGSLCSNHQYLMIEAHLFYKVRKRLAFYHKTR